MIHFEAPQGKDIFRNSVKSRDYCVKMKYQQNDVNKNLALMLL